MAEEALNYKNNIKLLEEHNNEIADELFKNFLKQVENQPYQTTISITTGILEEIGLSDCAGAIINIQDLYGK
jgi:hypothetical protein